MSEKPRIVVSLSLYKVFGGFGNFHNFEKSHYSVGRKNFKFGDTTHDGRHLVNCSEDIDTVKWQCQTSVTPVTTANIVSSEPSNRPSLPIEHVSRYVQRDRMASEVKATKKTSPASCGYSTRRPPPCRMELKSTSREYKSKSTSKPSKKITERSQFYSKPTKYDHPSRSSLSVRKKSPQSWSASSRSTTSSSYGGSPTPKLKEENTSANKLKTRSRSNSTSTFSSQESYSSTQSSSTSSSDYSALDAETRRETILPDIPSDVATDKSGVSTNQSNSTSARVRSPDVAGQLVTVHRPVKRTRSHSVSSGSSVLSSRGSEETTPTSSSDSECSSVADTARPRKEPRNTDSLSGAAAEPKEEKAIDEPTASTTEKTASGIHYTLLETRIDPQVSKEKLNVEHRREDLDDTISILNEDSITTFDEESLQPTGAGRQAEQISIKTAVDRVVPKQDGGRDPVTSSTSSTYRKGSHSVEVPSSAQNRITETEREIIIKNISSPNKKHSVASRNSDDRYSAFKISPCIVDKPTQTRPTTAANPKDPRLESERRIVISDRNQDTKPVDTEGGERVQDWVEQQNEELRVKRLVKENITGTIYRHHGNEKSLKRVRRRSIDDHHHPRKYQVLGPEYEKSYIRSTTAVTEEKGYNEWRDHILGIVTNAKSTKCLFLDAILDRTMCNGFAIATANTFCEGSGIPYDFVRNTNLVGRTGVTPYRDTNWRHSQVDPNDIIKFTIANTDFNLPILVACGFDQLLGNDHGSNTMFLNQFCRLDKIEETALRHTSGKPICRDCYPKEERHAVYVTKCVGEEQPRLCCQYHARYWYLRGVNLQIYLPVLVSVNENNDHIWLSTSYWPYEEHNLSKTDGWVPLAYSRGKTNWKVTEKAFKSKGEFLLRVARNDGMPWSGGDYSDPINAVRAMQYLCKRMSTGELCSPAEPMGLRVTTCRYNRRHPYHRYSRRNDQSIYHRRSNYRYRCR